MKRDDVFKLIDGERIYQDILPQHSKINDENTPISSWILYLEVHINKAKNKIYDLDKIGALEEIRKISAIGVACMEYNNTPNRCE